MIPGQTESRKPSPSTTWIGTWLRQTPAGEVFCRDGPPALCWLRCWVAEPCQLRWSLSLHPICFLEERKLVIIYWAIQQLVGTNSCHQFFFEGYGGPEKGLVTNGERTRVLKVFRAPPCVCGRYSFHTYFLFQRSGRRFRIKTLPRLFTASLKSV